MLPQLFARRYLFSSQSRSVVNLIAGLSVAAVAMPVAAMIILLSVFNGFESLVKSMYSAFDADLTVTLRQGQTFAQGEIDSAALRRIPGVGALSFTLEQSALLEHGGRQATATVRGVDDAYAEVFALGDAVSAGEWRVRLGDLERLVIGQSMAWMLGIRSLADADVTLYAVRRGSFSSLLPLENYTRRTEPVGGVYTLDLDTERTYVLSSLRLAQELFGYPGRASSLVVRLDPGADAAGVRRAVAEAVGDDFRVRTRDELRASFYRIMAYEKWGIFFIALLVLVIASFSVVGALAMLIVEKRGDIATLRALGADTGLDTGRVPLRRISDMRSGSRRRCRTGCRREPRAAAFRVDRDSRRDVPHEELPRRVPFCRPVGRSRRLRRRGRSAVGRHGAQYVEKQRMI